MGDAIAVIGPSLSQPEGSKRDVEARGPGVKNFLEAHLPGTTPPFELYLASPANLNGQYTNVIVGVTASQ